MQLITYESKEAFKRIDFTSRDSPEMVPTEFRNVTFELKFITWQKVYTNYRTVIKITTMWRAFK